MDVKNLEKELAAAVENAGSLSEIETWLRSRSDARSVELANYLLKSYPPQREFVLEFDMPDGSTATKIVNVFELGNGRFRFNEMRSQ